MEEAVTQLPESFQAWLAEAAVCKYRKVEVAAKEKQHKPVQVDCCNAECEDKFFQTVSDECVNNCVSSFIDATGNKATDSGTCAVCTGNFFPEN